jgi:uncharacterized protein (DUF488 family)
LGWIRGMLRGMSERPIYTIGYGARSVEELVALLQEHQIAYLIDIRSQPYSRYKPEYSKEPLEGRLRREGVRYVFMGDSLGGRPADEGAYDGDGKVDYEKVRELVAYREGIDRLRQAWEQDLGVVLMCSEGKPENCHRSKLIGLTLEEEGIPVIHVDEEGRLLTQEEVMTRITGGQPSLFGPSFLKLTSRKKYWGDQDEG